MSPTLEQYTVNLQEKGELIIPESVCKQLNLQPGDRFTLTIETDGSLRLVSLRQQVQKLKGVSLADELIQERRQEALREREL